MSTVRAINAQLSDIRRRAAPQRGTFERVSEEIGGVEGLTSDSEQYFERIYQQMNRLVAAVDATANAVAQLANLRLNETMYWLTVVATVFLPDLDHRLLRHELRLDGRPRRFGRRVLRARRGGVGCSRRADDVGGAAARDACGARRRGRGLAGSATAR
jgi:hypothetical protein